jgi:hypothetical protein
MGSEGELYNMQGRDPRRPGESGRVFFNPIVTLGPVTFTGNFLLSTEGSSLIGLGGVPGRQRINQFGLSPQWSWGKASLGSFSDTWSQLTWGGVRVDGVGFDLSPKALRLGMFSGSSRQAVFGGATSGSYARSIAGARVGAGKKPEYGGSSRWFDVVVLRVRDDASSLPPLPDSTPVPYLPDSLATAPDTALLPHVPINPYSVTPQENACRGDVRRPELPRRRRYVERRDGRQPAFARRAGDTAHRRTGWRRTEAVARPRDAPAR